jgi:hypothetical protein
MTGSRLIACSEYEGLTVTLAVAGFQRINQSRPHIGPDRQPIDEHMDALKRVAGEIFGCLKFNDFA